MEFSLIFAGLWAWQIAYAAMVGVTRARWLRGQRRASAPPPPTPASWPELLVLCPLSGGDRTEFESFRLPPYRGRLRFVFLAAQGDLSAQLRATRRVSALRRLGVEAAAVQTVPRGRNPKVSQLAQVPSSLMAGAAVVLVQDSDVDGATVDATGLVRRLLAEPALAFIWQPTVPATRPQTRADTMAAGVFAASHFAMPISALFAPAVAVGKVLAYRPEILRLVGGWSACAHVLGEDLHASEMVQAMGGTVSPLDGRPAHSLRRHEGLVCIARRLVRWHRIVREQAPRWLLPFPAFVLFWPLQGIACLAAWRAGVGPWVAPTFAAATMLRLAFAALALRIGHRPVRVPVALAALAGDWLTLAALCAALFSGRVHWHGLDVSRGCRKTSGKPIDVAASPRAARSGAISQAG